MIRRVCLLLMVGALTLSACGTSSRGSVQQQTDQGKLQATIDTMQATVDASNSTGAKIQPTSAAGSAAVTLQPTPTPQSTPSSQVTAIDTASLLSNPQETTIQDAIAGCWRIEELENTDWGLWLSDFLCFMADGAYFASYIEGGRYELSDDGTLTLNPNRTGDPVSALVETSAGGAIKFSSGGPIPDSLVYTRTQEDQNLKSYLVGKWDVSPSQSVYDFSTDNQLLLDGEFRAWYAVLDDNTLLIGAPTGSPEIPENGGVLYAFRIHVKSEDAFELVVLGWDGSKFRLVEADEASQYFARIQ